MKDTIHRELTGTQLKWIALMTMIIDHVGVILLEPGSGLYWAARYIGRLAFPLYCFLLVEGFVHTRNVRRYFGRLMVFALISEIPFDMAHGCFRAANVSAWTEWLGELMRSQNVFFTLAIGLMALWGYVRLNNQCQPMMALAWCAAMCGLAWMMKADYGFGGVAWICILYRFRQEPQMRFVWGAGTLLLAISPQEWPALLDFWLFSRYHGKRGDSRYPWLFYAAYPIHLLLLYLIGLVVK